MLAYLEVPVGWGELLRRTARECYEDDIFSLAAQLAYYFFLSLFPALLFFVALASFFPIQHLMDEVVRTLGRFAPPDIVAFVLEQLRELSNRESGGILTFAFLFTIWSTSAAMVAIIGTLDRAYDIEDSRPWWKVRLLAVGLTIALVLFILISFALVLGGPPIAERLADRLALGAAFEWSWKILQWPVVFLLVVTAVALVYYFAPDAEQEFVLITPGALVATLLWIAISVGFRLYVVNFGEYNETYGALGGVIVLLLWFYLSGLAILAGAEMNAEIEHLSPYGKAPGEKVPGERRRIGARAGRLAAAAARGAQQAAAQRKRRLAARRALRHTPRVTRRTDPSGSRTRGTPEGGLPPER